MESRIQSVLSTTNQFSLCGLWSVVRGPWSVVRHLSFAVFFTTFAYFHETPSAQHPRLFLPPFQKADAGTNISVCRLRGVEYAARHPALLYKLSLCTG